MASAFERQLTTPGISELSFDDRLGLLLEQEVNDRRDRSCAARLRRAQLRVRASVEEVSCKSGRGLSQRLLTQLAEGQWIRAGANLVIIGKSGVGKSFLACALGHQACRQEHSVLYRRATDLAEDLAHARLSGQRSKRLKQLTRLDLLIIDDWGLQKFDADSRRDVLDLIESRDRRASTLVASQLPVPQWHAVIGEGTIADAIVDRLVSYAHRVELQGGSMRRIHGPPPLEES